MGLWCGGWCLLDAWLLAVLEDEELRRQVRQLKKAELAHVWQLTQAFLTHRHNRAVAP
jgi:transcriptional regulator of met regulon